MGQVGVLDSYRLVAYEALESWREMHPSGFQSGLAVSSTGSPKLFMHFLKVCNIL
jgi:hypothetical protein